MANEPAASGLTFEVIPNQHDELKRTIREASANRNREQLKRAIEGWLKEKIDGKLRSFFNQKKSEINAENKKKQQKNATEAATHKDIRYEGRSLHFASHSLGNWIRLPEPNKKESPKTIGHLFFRDNLYVKFYDHYFRKIPTEFLVSLNSPRDSQSHRAFDDPTVVLIFGEKSKNAVGNLSKEIKEVAKIDRVINLPLKTIENIRKIITQRNGTEESDALELVLDACYLLKDSDQAWPSLSDKIKDFKNAFKKDHKRDAHSSVPNVGALIEQLKEVLTDQKKRSLYEIVRNLNRELSYDPKCI